MKLGIFYDDAESSSHLMEIGESAVVQPHSSDQIAVEDSADLNHDQVKKRRRELEESSKPDASDSPVRNELE